MATKYNVAVAPVRQGGDQIELSAFDGKLVAVLCKARDEKKTKFGPKKMTQVYFATKESKDALVGVMFQSYFQDLPLNQWFIGKVTKVDAGNNRMWTLSTEGLDAKLVKELAKHLGDVKLEDESAANLL